MFRLCGGRIENLGELGPLAVRAGLNGVMMGNFLTALGATPAEDREMFERHGLNISRQPDNGSNPRPDNRAGWLEVCRPLGTVFLDAEDERARRLYQKLGFEVIGARLVFEEPTTCLERGKPAFAGFPGLGWG